MAAISGVLFPSVFLFAGLSGGMTPSRLEVAGCQNEEPSVQKRTVPEKTISKEGFFYEDFESSKDYAFPDGWTVTSTPGNPDDGWRVGTITMDGSPVAGPSGLKYAFIFSNGENAHDAWAISPAVYLNAGSEYQIEFYAMTVSSNSTKESFEVAIGTTPTVESMGQILDSVGDTDSKWEKKIFTYTPEESGNYYIGFHSNSPKNAENAAGTLIDDLKIYTGSLPILSGATICDLGVHGNLDAAASGSVEFYNRGSATLTLSLKSASEGLETEGLPLEIEPYMTESFKVSLTGAEIGDYSGQIVLTTNDPVHPELTVDVTAVIEESRHTGFHFEDFESGGPEGWDLPQGVVNTADYSGHNSSRCIYSTTYYTMLEGNGDGVGFTTHYVDMGEAPVFSFWYQLTDNSFFGGGDATDADRPIVKVLVSEDGGATWNKEYEISKDGDEQHVPSMDYRKVTVDLPKYANKTCRVRLLFHQSDGDDPMSLMMNNIQVLVDDVTIGTAVPQDVSIDFLRGNAVVRPGEENIAKVSVSNRGSETVASYDVELIDRTGDKVLSKISGVDLGAGETKDIDLSWSVSEVGRHDLSALIHMLDDSNPDNDESNILAVDVVADDNKVVNFDHGKTLRSSAYPIAFGNVETVTQSIYTANEIGVNRAQISSIVFTSTMDAPFKGESFEVMVGETEKEEFADGIFVDAKNFVKVFDGIVFFDQGLSDVVIPFSEAYEYKGGNLVVMCRKLGKEFVNKREFIVHETENYRSIQAFSPGEGELGEGPVYKNSVASRVLPQARLNLITYPTGSLKGTVTCGGTALSGVKVSVEGSAFYAYTDNNGCYEFPALAEGDYSMSFEKHGYYTISGKTVKLNAGESSVLDAVIENVPTYKVTGTISESGTGKPLGGVEITLDGYDRYSATTDADGKFIIEDVYGTGSENPYAVRTTSEYFENYCNKLAVSSDVVADIELEGSLLRPTGVNASNADGCVKVEWSEPNGELRHDTGEYDTCLGFHGGYSEIIFGSAYRCKGKITEVSWYVTDDDAEHSNFNVFVFGLDADGNPDPKNILYVAANVDYTDNAWSVHRLTKPVEADGFMIAVSCTGFMGIGVTKPNDAYPFERGMYYYAGESYNYLISDMSNYMDCHLMLRATVEDDSNATRPTQKYDVYRIVNDAPRDEWTLIGTTEDLSFEDVNAASFEGSELRYAVVARKGGCETMPVISGPIKPSSVVEVVSDSEIRLGFNATGDRLLIHSSVELARIDIVDMSGSIVVSENRPAETVDVSSLVSGVYVVRLQADNGYTCCRKLVRH